LIGFFRLLHFAFLLHSSCTFQRLSIKFVLPLVYTLFGDGEGWGYTVCLLFNICQSHQQKSAARMPQIFDHRSMSVSHSTRNLWHVCRRIFLNLSVVHHLAGTSMKSAERMQQIFR
jgi:hypothetical protein